MAKVKIGKPFSGSSQLFVVKNFSNTHTSFIKPLAIGFSVPGPLPTFVFRNLRHGILGRMELLLALVRMSAMILHLKIILNGDKVNLTHLVQSQKPELQNLLQNQA